MRRILIEEVEHIAFSLARDLLTYDEPIPDFTTRFPHILESCLATPFQAFDKKYLYRTLIAKASILFYLMNKNHPFQNGNKRIAVTTLLYFLRVNNKWLTVNEEDLYEFAVSVAESKRYQKERTIIDINNFIKDNLIEWQKVRGKE